MRSGRYGSRINIYEQGQIEILTGSHSNPLPLHSHECWCIGLVTEGEVYFKIREQENLLKRGELYVIPSNAGVTIIPKNEYHFITICFKGELGEKFQSIELMQYFLRITDTESFMRIFYDFMWYGDREKIVRDYLELMKPITMTTKGGQYPKRSEMVEKAIEFMRKNQKEKFDLNNIAAEAGVSKYHLVRLFKKEMGVTPNQYYIQNKLRQVKARIMEEEPEIQIAVELNYSDQSHLCRQFKQMMGVSLQEYKRNFRKK